MKLLNRPMFFCMCACCVASFCSFYSSVFIPLLAALATAVVFVLVIFYGAYKRLFFLLIIFLMLLRSINAFDKKVDFINAFSGDSFVAELTVIEEPKLDSDGYTTTVSADFGGELGNNIKLNARYPSEKSVKMGDRLNAHIVVSAFSDADYMRYCFSNDIMGECEITELKKLKAPNFIYKTVGKIRQHMRASLYSCLSYESASTVLALVVGDSSALDEDFSRAVTNSGVSHVMVVSGMHLTIIMGALQRLMFFLKRNSLVGALFSVLTVLFIAAVCGFSTSVMRAAIMYIVSSVSFIGERRADSLSSLSLAVIILLILSPYSLFSVALQLSALATFGILVVAPELMRLVFTFVEPSAKWVRGAVELVCVTVSANIMTAPVAIYAFSRLSLTSVITNLLINHAVNFALGISVVAVVLCAFSFTSFLGRLLFLVCEVAVLYINYIIELLGADGTAIEVGKGAFFISAALLIISLYAIDTCKKRRYLLELKEQEKTYRLEG